MVSLISSYGIEGDELVLRFDNGKEYGRYSIIDKGSYVQLFYEGEEYKKVD